MGQLLSPEETASWSGGRFVLSVVPEVTYFPVADGFPSPSGGSSLLAMSHGKPTR